jgi:hypothetical protein
MGIGRLDIGYLSMDFKPIPMADLFTRSLPNSTVRPSANLTQILPTQQISHHA